MIEESASGTQLCPHCANTIPEDAAECAFCKAAVSLDSPPSWLQRDESSPRREMAPQNRRLTAFPARFLWPGAMLAAVLLAFFAGAYFRGADSSALDGALKQLQAKDLMVQSQGSQLMQARQTAADKSEQITELKAKLEAAQKELVAAEQRLAAAQRAAAGGARPRATSRVTARASAAAPQPVVARQAAADVYVTTRPTGVYENPSSTSRMISQIDRGTRINVVGSSGGWLEVRSRRGNPPGYVLSTDARPTGGAN
jgi:hypothetical protein